MRGKLLQSLFLWANSALGSPFSDYPDFLNFLLVWHRGLKGLFRGLCTVSSILFFCNKIFLTKKINKYKEYHRQTARLCLNNKFSVSESHETGKM